MVKEHDGFREDYVFEVISGYWLQKSHGSSQVVVYMLYLGYFWFHWLLSIEYELSMVKWSSMYIVVGCWFTVSL